MENFVKSDVEGIQLLVGKYNELKVEIAKKIIGQEEVVKNLLVSILSNGHCLLIGVPGLAKTMMINTLSKVLGLSYNRIQFTPDLMPSDIIGTEILDEMRKFKFVKGPIFANIVLADEINRTPPKTQSALLEAMQEKSVTAAGVTYKLDAPFFVLATQNPIEQEGTYPLPEAQLDRFMFNIRLGYPTFEEEKRIVSATTIDEEVQLNEIISTHEILYFQKLIRRIPVTNYVLEYAIKLTTASRPRTSESFPFVDEFISWGAGPRASQYLIIAAKTHAAINGKYSPDVEDVNAVAKQVLYHRIIPNYKAEAEGLSVDDIILEIIKHQTK